MQTNPAISRTIEHHFLLFCSISWGFDGFNMFFSTIRFLVDLQWEVFIHITNPHNIRALWKNVELGDLLLQTGAYIYIYIILWLYNIIYTFIWCMYLYHDKMYVNEYGYNLYIYICIQTWFFSGFTNQNRGSICSPPCLGRFPFRMDCSFWRCLMEGRAG